MTSFWAKNKVYIILAAIALVVAFLYWKSKNAKDADDNAPASNKPSSDASLMTNAVPASATDSRSTTNAVKDAKPGVY